FGAFVLPAVVLCVRVYAYVRGEVSLGRALSIFAVLFLPDAVVTYLRLPGEWVTYVLAALWVVSAAAPVRRASVLRSPLP
ncbi:hypothetical protein, partial [Lentzea kentuckyensis]|uniref:hypothetical protein n=1 Tax=Lentzea kentuckyensis TaxID=360086 RepID=UPI001302595F